MCIASESFQLLSFTESSLTLLTSYSSLPDVEAIIAKGVRDTQALNDKMQQFTDNARQFTMDGGIIEEFKEEDEDDVGVIR
jgi:hypothetical protein